VTAKSTAPAGNLTSARRTGSAKVSACCSLRCVASSSASPTKATMTSTNRNATIGTSVRDEQALTCRTICHDRRRR
jgi:hypothetical protein